MPTVAPEQTSLRKLGAPGGGGGGAHLYFDGGKNVDVTLAETGFEFVEVPRKAMVTHLLVVPVQCSAGATLSHRASLVTVQQRRWPLERLLLS